MRSPEIDSDMACEICRGTGSVAYGPWGVRPPKKECPECGGSGWRIQLVGEIRQLTEDMGFLPQRRTRLDSPSESVRGDVLSAALEAGLVVQRATPLPRVGGNIEAAVNARLAYDRSHGEDVANTWITIENQLDDQQYVAYQRMYQQRRARG